MSTSIETTTGLLDAVLADLAGIVGRIAPGQDHDPTPCTEYDVALLRQHILGWLTVFAAGYADPDGQTRASIEDYQAPEDPDEAAGVVRAAARELTTAVRGGAARRPLKLGENAMPGEVALGMILMEYQIHGWDLAVATGQAWSPSEDAVREATTFASAMLTEDSQGEGKSFGVPVPVPDPATPLERLLGMSGRDPLWRARKPDQPAGAVRG